MARRFMWDVISAIQKEHSVILTTHLMADCDDNKVMFNFTCVV